MVRRFVNPPHEHRESALPADQALRRRRADTLIFVRSTLLAEVLSSAARLQRIVPDEVLVGGTAVALHVGHRESFDHDQTRPLEVEQVTVAPGDGVRDYLDPVALADRMGVDGSTKTLAAIDEYYTDRSGEDDSVLTVLTQRLAEPNPRDKRVTGQLHSYKGLVPRWHEWGNVVEACHALADALLTLREGRR